REHPTLLRPAGTLAILQRTGGVPDGSRAGRAVSAVGPAGTRHGASAGGAPHAVDHPALAGRTAPCANAPGAEPRALRPAAASRAGRPLWARPYRVLPRRGGRDSLAAGLPRPGSATTARCARPCPGGGASLKPRLREDADGDCLSAAPRNRRRARAGRGAHRSGDRAWLCTLSGDRWDPAWSDADRARPAGGQIDQIRQDLAAVRETGSALWEPYFLALLADLCAQEGQVEAGLATLDEALAAAQGKGQRMVEAELYRLRGSLLL